MTDGDGGEVDGGGAWRGGSAPARVWDDGGRWWMEGRRGGAVQYYLLLLDMAY